MAISHHTVVLNLICLIMKAYDYTEDDFSSKV